MATQVKVADRTKLELSTPVKVETLYRRAGEAPKPVTFYVIGYAVVRGQGRLLATNDPADVSDGKLTLRFVDSISKLSKHTTVEEWDISADEVQAVLSGLYFFPYSSAYRQVQHVDVDNADEVLEATQGYGGAPFSEIQAESVTISLIETE